MFILVACILSEGEKQYPLALVFYIRYDNGFTVLWNWMLYPGRQKKNAKDEKEERHRTRRNTETWAFSLLELDSPLYNQLIRARVCEAQESIPNLADRYDNPIWLTGPPGYIGWRNRFLGIDPGLVKRLQIQAQPQNKGQTDRNQCALTN